MRNPFLNSPQARVRASLASIRRNRWNKNVPIEQRLRNAMSLTELVEMKKTAKALRAWSAVGCPIEERRGPERLYFTFTRSGLKIAIRDCPLTTPDLSYGFNSGWAFDGLEAWRITVKQAYAPSYFWVAVQAGRACPGRERFTTYAFHSPWREQDVLLGAQHLMPVECKVPLAEFRWSASWNPPTLGTPWALSRSRTDLTTFFGLEAISESTFLVGTSAAPAQRCGAKGLWLLGTSRLERERVYGKLAAFQTKKPGWFVATEQSLMMVAKMAAKHARAMILPKETS